MSRRPREQSFGIGERSSRDSRQNLRSVPPVLQCPTRGRTRCPCNKVDSGSLPSDTNPVLGVLPLNAFIAQAGAHTRPHPRNKSGWGQDTQDRDSKPLFSPASTSLSTDRVSSPGWDTAGQAGQAGQAAIEGWSA